MEIFICFIINLSSGSYEILVGTGSSCGSCGLPTKLGEPKARVYHWQTYLALSHPAARSAIAEFRIW
jgi:hypothetical protein